MLISTLLSLGFSISAAAADRSPLVVESCEFQETYQFNQTDCSIQLHNRGHKPIIVSNIRSLRANDSVPVGSLTVPAQGVAELSVTVAVENDVGYSKHYYGFQTDISGEGERFAEARGFVASVLDDIKPRMQFGVVDLKAPAPRISVDLATSEIGNFKVVKIISAPPHLNVAIENDGRTIVASPSNTASWGVHDGDFIKVGTNSSKQSQIWIATSVDIHGEIVPASNPFALGLMRIGADNEFLIRLNSKGGADFSVGKVAIEGISGGTNVVPCLPETKGCKQIKFKVDSDQKTGQIGGVIRIHLPDYNQVLPVYLWGMLLSPDVVVQDLDEIKDSAMLSGGTQSRNLDLRNALRRAVRYEGEPVPVGSGPLIKWSATNEQFVYGYAIYRAASESGPFLRMNRDTILVRNKDGSESMYQWRDRSVDAGKTYWYYVGLINRDGSKQKLSSPQKVISK